MEIFIILWVESLRQDTTDLLTSALNCLAGVVVSMRMDPTGSYIRKLVSQLVELFGKKDQDV